MFLSELSWTFLWSAVFIVIIIVTRRSSSVVEVSRPSSRLLSTGVPPFLINSACRTQHVRRAVYRSVSAFFIVIIIIVASSKSSSVVEVWSAVVSPAAKKMLPL